MQYDLKILEDNHSFAVFEMWTVASNGVHMANGHMMATVCSLVADGHPPTADTCNAAIRSCDGPRWREQLELLQEMRRTFWTEGFE